MICPRFYCKRILFESPIPRACLVVMITAAWACGRGPVAVAASPSADTPEKAESGAGWQASDAPPNPFRAAAPEQWAPSRNHLRNKTPSASTTPAKPSQRSGESVDPSDRSSAKNDAVASRPPVTAPRWLLPNQKATPDDAGADGETKDTKPTAASTASSSDSGQQSSPREPRPFIPAANVVKLPSGGPMGGQSKQTGSAAIAQASGAPARPTNSPASRTNQSAAANYAGPSSAGYVGAGRANVSRDRQAPPNTGSYASRLWKNVTVAFQAPDQWGGTFQPDGPPMPGGEYDMGRFYGPYVTSPDGSYGVYGEPGCGCPSGCGDSCGCGCGGNCGGDCGCGDGVVGCGDACEPGCGCGSSCGCNSSGGCGSGCGCGCGGLALGWGDAESCHTIRIRVPKWQELTAFGGVQGFKGPYDMDRDSGNFGFHEGFNAGFKVPFSKMGYQIGYRAVQSQLSGDKDTDISDPYTQQFVTAGFFRRAKDGLQGGVVWDMLRDERFRARSFHQVRGELSMIDRGCHEWGLAVAFHLNDHEFDDDDDSTLYQASDQYLLFYRFHGSKGGDGRFYGGLNDDSDGIVGADMLLPLTDRWSLAAGFTYLIPHQGGGEEGASQEAWNIGMSMVWHWDNRARKSHSNCYRPLFNVADNGYLIVDEREGDD